MTSMHQHEDARSDRRLLALALAVLGVFMVAEVVLGILAHSLALLADAGHMLTDASALALALFASWAAGLPVRGRWTFGFARAEILAAQANGITLLVIAVLILYSAVRRLFDPPTSTERLSAQWRSAGLPSIWACSESSRAPDGRASTSGGPTCTSPRTSWPSWGPPWPVA